ncbi:MAG: glycogen debranching N-terminal domain-containing protein, partial [Mycobacteriales bacterium]
MTEGWAYGGAPPAAGAAGMVTLIEGAAFCISGRSGDINPGAEQGLFFRDTRFLCRWRVSVAGQQLDPLTVMVT